MKTISMHAVAASTRGGTRRFGPTRIAGSVGAEVSSPCCIDRPAVTASAESFRYESYEKLVVTTNPPAHNGSMVLFCPLLRLMPGLISARRT